MKSRSQREIKSCGLSLIYIKVKTSYTWGNTVLSSIVCDSSAIDEKSGAKVLRSIQNKNCSNNANKQIFEYIIMYIINIFTVYKRQGKE